MKGITTSVISTISMLISLSFGCQAHAISSAEHHFIGTISAKHHIPKLYLNHLFQQAETLPKVLHAISHPYEKMPWHTYRAHFVNQDRVQAGVNFWKSHEKTLNRIAKQYHVDPSIIVGILGVETHYGERQGTYSAFNALYTLAFHYPKRASFFKEELESLIEFSYRERLDPVALKSSYAGALGIPQFMPSTYLKYAVNFNKTKHIDLTQDVTNAMASVANFLSKHGWQAHKPVAIPCHIRAKSAPLKASKTAKPLKAVSYWHQHGVTLNQPIKGNPHAALIKLPNSKTPQHWLTFANFHVIMNYNPRVVYAMAVYQLAQQIKAQHEGTS